MARKTTRFQMTFCNSQTAPLSILTGQVSFEYPAVQAHRVFDGQLQPPAGQSLVTMTTQLPPAVNPHLLFQPKSVPLIPA